MRPESIYAVALAMALMLFEINTVGAAENTVSESSRLLITFENNALHVPSVPGRNYRFRSRYLISQAAQIDARAVAKDYQLRTIDDWPIESLGIYCVLYEAAGREQLAALIAKLDADPRVESVQPLQRFQSMTTYYNDSYAGFQYGLQSMNIAQAHQYAQGNGVRVAIIDTSIDLNHEDLSSDAIHVRNFVRNSNDIRATEHGTAVVSVIAADSNNQKGIVGVAPRAELIALSACWSENEVETAHCNSFTLAKAMDYLIQSSPDLLNLSIAGPHDALLGRLIEVALQNGTIIVAAAPDSRQNEHVYPADFPGVIAIGSATAENENHLELANSTFRLFAPGEQIMVALPDDLYDFRSGSSLASANASGVIALLLQHAPNLDSEQISTILHTSQTENGYGVSMINACRALAEIGAADSCQ